MPYFTKQEPPPESEQLTSMAFIIAAGLLLVISVSIILVRAVMKGTPEKERGEHFL